MSMTDTLPSFLLRHFGHVEDVDKDGALNVPALAVHLDVHPYTIWWWLKKGLPWKGAQTLLRASEGRFERNDLIPFLAG